MENRYYYDIVKISKRFSPEMPCFGQPWPANLKVEMICKHGVLKYYRISAFKERMINIVKACFGVIIIGLCCVIYILSTIFSNGEIGTLTLEYSPIEKGLIGFGILMIYMLIYILYGIVKRKCCELCYLTEDGIKIRNFLSDKFVNKDNRVTVFHHSDKQEIILKEYGKIYELYRGDGSRFLAEFLSWYFVCNDLHGIFDENNIITNCICLRNMKKNRNDERFRIKNEIKRINKEYRGCLLGPAMCVGGFILFIVCLCVMKFLDGKDVPAIVVVINVIFVLLGFFSFFISFHIMHDYENITSERNKIISSLKKELRGII